MPFLLNNFKLLFEEIQEEDAEKHEIESGTRFITLHGKSVRDQHAIVDHSRASTASHGTMATTTPELEENRRAFTRLMEFPDLLAQTKLMIMSDTQRKMYNKEALAASRQIFGSDFINNMTFLKRWFSALEIKTMKTCLGIQMPRREGKTEEMKAFALGWLTTQRIGNVCTFHPKERNSKLFLKGVEDLLKRYVSIMKIGTIKREGDEELKYNGPHTKESFISCFAYPVLTIETHILKATLFFF